MESLPNDIKIQILNLIPRRVHPCSNMMRPSIRKVDLFMQQNMQEYHDVDYWKMGGLIQHLLMDPDDRQSDLLIF